jgi:hypothetical protein
MLHHFQLPSDWREVARVCEPEREAWVGSSRHLRWDENGRLVIGFGKHAGVPVAELAKGPDATYLMWIANKDFPIHVREICGRALEMDGAALEAWVRRIHGGGEPVADEVPAAVEQAPPPEQPAEPRPAAVQLGLALG